MANRHRDRHIRDSGLPTNDDSLITVAGGDDSPSDTDSEELIHNLFHPSPSPPRTPSPDIMANPIPAGQVRPQQIANIIWSEWRLTVIAATVRIALVDILDLSEVDIPAGCLLYTSPSPRD